MTLATLKLLIKTLILEAERNTKEVFVYHISPEANLSPQQLKTGVYSPKFRKFGLFTAPLTAIKNSWADYASGKGRFGGGRDQTYENLTLYKLGMPKWVFDEAEERHDARANQEIKKNPDTALGAWGWDIETFIPEDLLKHVRIESRETKKTKEFVKGRHERQKHVKGQKKYHQTQYSYDSEGNLIKNVVTYGNEPTSLEKILAASDEALKLLKKEELENVVKKLEYFLSPEWIDNKIKEYMRERANKAKYGTKLDREIYSDFNPVLPETLRTEAEALVQSRRGAADRKLSIARNLLKTKS